MLSSCVHVYVLCSTFLRCLLSAIRCFLSLFLYAFLYFLLLLCFFVQFSHKKLKYTRSSERPHMHTTHTYIGCIMHAFVFVVDIVLGCLCFFCCKRPESVRGQLSRTRFVFFTPFHQAPLTSYRRNK